jgi:hypothetical protein
MRITIHLLGAAHHGHVHTKVPAVANEFGFEPVRQV